MADARLKELPKFNAGVMLVLGVIIGMLSYFLVFYARAGVLAGGDLVPKHVSYGSGNIRGQLEASETCVLNKCEEVVAWFTPIGTSIKIYTYVTNVGTAGSGGAKVRFCDNASVATCSTPASVTTVPGQVGALKGTSSLTVNNKEFVESDVFAPATGPHVFMACVVGSSELPDSLANNCTSIKSLVATPPNVVRPTFLSQAVCNNLVSVGCNRDGYGSTSYTPPNRLLTAVSDSFAWGGWFIGAANAQQRMPECDDDSDNDRDGLTDWDGVVNGFKVSDPDPGCVGPSDPREEKPARPVCPGYPNNPHCEI